MKQKLERSANVALSPAQMEDVWRWHPQDSGDVWGGTKNMVLTFIPVDSGLTLYVPTEQEKEEDRFHPLPRLRIDMASPGKPR